MNVIDKLILFWLLPSLVAALCLIVTERFGLGFPAKKPEKYSESDWLIWLFMSVAYPLACFILLIILAKYFVMFTSKEIKLPLPHRNSNSTGRSDQ